MKNIVFSFFFLICLGFTSIGQNSSWRTNPPQKSTSTNSQSTSSVNNFNTVSSWRNDTPSDFNKPQRNKTVFIRDPWFDFGWNRWTYPSYGWNSYLPSYYYNNWGYRQPARVYYYDNGKIDTLKGKRPIFSFGIHHTTNSQMGAFLTIGNKGYFVLDFNTTYKRDRSTFFPYGTINLVDFPLISDLNKQSSFYFGLGKRINRFGIHGMIGFAKERVLWRGVDDIGEITLPKRTENFVTFKFGFTKDFKNFTTKVDFDPIVNYGQVGLGLNF